MKASATYRRAMVGWTDHNVACSIACYSSHITTLFLHQLQFLVTSESKSVPALGRPFRLGDYYNEPNGDLVLGVSLKNSVLDYPKTQMDRKSEVGL